MGKPTIDVLDATLGAVVTDVLLAELDDDAWSTIADAFLAHAVLVFPGQHLTEEQQAAFGARFGPFEHIFGTSGLIPVSNVDADGRVRSADDPRTWILRGNEGWHTDSSYMPIAAKASMLSAHVLPPAGGETEWADMRAAYDALGADVKARIAPLSAYHSLVHSQAKAGFAPAPGGYGFDVDAPPLRPLVKIHPETARPSLFVGRHAYGIPGLSETESEQLLDELLTFACQSPRTYTHSWAVGDLVVWDNRCVLHRARPYDTTQARVMKHTRIKGNPVTEGATLTTAS